MRYLDLKMVEDASQRQCVLQPRSSEMQFTTAWYEHPLHINSTEVGSNRIQQIQYSTHRLEEELSDKLKC